MKKIFIFLTLLLFACSKAPQKPKGATIIMASIGEPSYLNPILASDSASFDIIDKVFNGLMKYDKDLNLVGDLAEKWEVSPDGLKITFFLKKNVFWHDGAPFTSKDVLFTYKALVDPHVLSPHSADFKRIKEVKIPDDYTVGVFYKEPFAPALESWGMDIIPEHLYKGTDINTNPHNKKPIGTGPYKFLKWISGDKIILQKNENYFEKMGNITRIVYRIIPDESVQFLELKKQNIDMTGITPYQYKFQTNDPAFNKTFQKFKYPNFSYAYLGFNLKNELFKDKKIRHAIAHAINKKEIIDAVLFGLGRPAKGPFPPVSWAYDKNLNDIEYNPQKSKEILEKLGWEDRDRDGVLEKNGKDFSFTILTNQGNKMREETATIIQAQLKKIGIEVKIRLLEWASFIHQYIDTRNFDAVILGWSLSVDPDQFSIWHSSEDRPGGFNFVGYKNPEADRLLEEGRKTFDIGKRKEIYKKFQQILVEDHPYVFLYVMDSLPVVHRRFYGIQVGKAGITHNFIKWYVPENLIKYKL